MARSPEHEQGTDQEIQGDRWISRLHLRDSRLARAGGPGDLPLREELRPSPLLEPFRQPPAELEIRLLRPGPVERSPAEPVPHASVTVSHRLDLPRRRY